MFRGWRRIQTLRTQGFRAMSPLATPPKPRTPWKPPIGLVLLDIVGLPMLLVGWIQYSAGADSPLAGVLPEAATLPLLVVGGTLAGLATLWATVSVLRHRRSG
jgi:hypothetical protein